MMALAKPEDKPAIFVRKRPRQQRSMKLVGVVLQAAAHILENGTVAFTTNHIAKKAGVSIGSLYQYFSSADAIMASLIEAHVEEEREAAQRVLQSNLKDKSNILRELVITFVAAHSRRPMLTARLHALAPSFGLQAHLDQSRDDQAALIAKQLGLTVQSVQMSAMAVEGVVLCTLTTDCERLTCDEFIDQLYAIALAPLRTQALV
jgi:AcrR family transcriptional regulator